MDEQTILNDKYGNFGMVHLSAKGRKEMTESAGELSLFILKN